MKFFKNFDWSAKSIGKVIGVIFLGIIAFSIAIALISFSFKTIFNLGQSSYDDYYGDYSRSEYAMEEASYFEDNILSSKSIVHPYPTPGYSTDTDAEDFEVKQYSGTIKTNKLDKTCEIISSLKAKDYVIFEDSNKNDDSCYYRFKVKKENTEEIVATIEELDPENFNVSVQSIKKHVEGIEDELSILQKKLDSIEETLETSQDSYDEISKLATHKQDAETLAKVIDSKLNLIERLTNQKLQVKEQIDRYNERKSSQLDQLDFTFFNINVYKDLIFDWENIKDTWKWEIKDLIRNVNEVFQAITLNLVTYLIRFIQVVIYLFVSLLLIKFVWIGTKAIWKGNFKKNKK